MLGPPDLIDAAKAEAARLLTQPRWALALTNATPEAPLIVERLDSTGGYYAIVGFRIGPRLTARIRLNAHSGAPGITSGIDARSAALTAYHTADQARVAVAGYVVGLGERDDPDDVAVHPFLVWRPSPESPNAFLPFYRLRRKSTDLYYRVDGRLFSALTRGSGV